MLVRTSISTPKTKMTTDDRRVIDNDTEDDPIINMMALSGLTELNLTESSASYISAISIVILSYNLSLI